MAKRGMRHGQQHGGQTRWGKHLRAEEPANNLGDEAWLLHHVWGAAGTGAVSMALASSTPRTCQQLLYGTHGVQ